MPNHVQNHIIFHCDGETFQKILKEICYEPNSKMMFVGPGTFDFNKVIPMPENIYRGSLGQKERELYGANNWYDWSRENWGTKWNSYENKFNEPHHLLSFQTAWNAPMPVIEALAKKFPEVQFEYLYADEDIGSNCGSRIFYNGNEEYQHFPTDFEAVCFAEGVWKLYDTFVD